MQSSSRTRFQTMLMIVAVLVATAFAFLVIDVSPVLAQTADLADVGDAAGLQQTNLFSVIGTIIGVFLSILGIIFLILVLYAGFLWMTAGGSDEKVNKAKRILIQAVIGLIITLSAFAITNFVVNALTGEGLFGGIGGSGGSGGTGPGFTTVPRSGSLGQGGIVDHFPARYASDISRNTKIFVTFKEPMDIDGFVDTYNDNDTPDDLSDDSATLNDRNIKIYPTNEGQGAALGAEDVSVSFTEDLKTVVFDPPLLGSATDEIQYTVVLSDNLQNVDGENMVNNGGYEWIFTVGTTIDVDPPTVRSVTPSADGTYGRNITVQITFSEAVDPTATTGTFSLTDTSENFGNIQVVGSTGAIVEGTYSISNEYKTITFQTSEACGTNSCNATIFCLPASDVMSVTAVAATPGADPPQVDIFPYDGVVDTSGNALDGNDDGVAGDNYAWSFETNNDIELSAPGIESITPEVLGANVDIDQRVLITFDDVMLTNSFVTGVVEELSPGNLSLEPSPYHELSYSPRFYFLNSDNERVVSTSQDVVKTEVEIDHGVFLVSTEDTTYNYGIDIGADVLNQYQNCFNPVSGPDAGAGTCEGAPYCCNGTPSTTACVLF